MGLVKEFKEFAIKGNVVDLAVGIVIGAAFSKIVSAFVANIVTPSIGLIVGGVNFKDLKFILQKAQGANAEVAVTYGAFLQAIFDFFIVSAAIFIVIKGINSMRKKKEAASEVPPPPTKQEILLEEIRDALKARQ